MCLSRAFKNYSFPPENPDDAMIKVSVLYPNEEGKTFNISYYRDKHFPLLKQWLGSSCIKAAFEHGHPGRAAGSKAIYITMCHLYFNSMDDFIISFIPHVRKIIYDLQHFTDTTPLFQISEVAR